MKRLVAAFVSVSLCIAAVLVRAQTNPHAPSRYRVTGVVANMPEFQKAFSCRGKAPMVSRKVCLVW